MTPIESQLQEPGSALALRQSNALSTHVVATAPVELDDSLHLRDLFRIVYKRKWWILSVALMLLGGATFRTLMETPIYRATAIVQIERNAARIVDYKDGTSNNTDSYDDREFLNTQFELIRSKALAERVMEALRLDVEKKQATIPKSSPSTTEASDSESVIGRVTATLRKRREIGRASCRERV